MPVSVSDTSSNWNETIEHGAKTLGRSKVRRRVFEAVYSGKKNPKSVGLLSKSSGLTRWQVLTEGKKLADEGLVHQTKSDGDTAYQKVRFYQKNRDRILRYVDKPEKLESLPTKRRPAAVRAKKGPQVSVSVQLPARRVRAHHITIDDISSFKKVRGVSYNGPSTKIPETKFKTGVASILQQRGEFKDWGGEMSDLISTHLRLAPSKRLRAAFAFKGPGMKGKLVPGKMGKNGDQIQRLMLCPADVFFVQYWHDMDASVLEQLEKLAQLKSYFEDRKIWFGIIDGQDSNRLMLAYPNAFPTAKIAPRR